MSHRELHEHIRVLTQRKNRERCALAIIELERVHAALAHLVESLKTELTGIRSDGRTAA